MNNIIADIIPRILNFGVGFSSIIILSLLISNNPKNIRIRYIIQILIIEILCGYFILHSEIGLKSIHKLCDLFNTLLMFSKTGINFVFGNTNTQTSSIFFLNVLCPIIFISALIGILQYFRILKYSTQIIGTILSKINGMGKLESFNMISSLILGQSENFILYKNIIQYISEPRIYTMATTAMSTVSLSIIGAYMTILSPKYVIAALVLNIFSTSIILSILNPYIVDKNNDLLLNTTNLFIKNQNLFEVIGEYILIGFKIATTIAAMLIGFIAIITTVNTIFKILCGMSLQETLGYIFYPFAWIIGFPSNEILKISSIMATKLISNEFIAMMDLQEVSNTLSARSIGILSVFLVSFSNFASIGILIGTIKEINETQGNIISKYGLKLIYSSTLINMLSAIVTGLLI